MENRDVVLVLPHNSRGTLHEKLLEFMSKHQLPSVDDRGEVPDCSCTELVRHGFSQCTKSQLEQIAVEMFSLLEEFARHQEDEGKGFVRCDSSISGVSSRQATGSEPERIAGKTSGKHLCPHTRLWDHARCGDAETDSNVSSVRSFASLRTPTKITHASHSVDNLGWNLLNNYTLLGEAGHGSHGKVTIAIPENQDIMVAIKAVSRGKVRQWREAMAARAAEESGEQRRPISPFPIRIQQEIAVMKSLHHPNVVSLLEVIDDPNENWLYLVMPYYERGPVIRLNATGRCTPMDINIVREYMRQLCRAVHYLHSRGVLHLDIKPDNVLLGNDGLVRLTDFGVSRSFGKDEAMSIEAGVGTPMFMAPESVCNGSEALVEGKPVDIWALGVTFFAMVCGYLPFSGNNYEEARHSICTSEVTVAIDGRTVLTTEEAEAGSLIKRMLEKDPTMRATMPEIRKHPFLRRNPCDAESHTPFASCMLNDSSGPIPATEHNDAKECPERICPETPACDCSVALEPVLLMSLG